jgi:N-formylglutamate amidohydrolase
VQAACQLLYRVSGTTSFLQFTLTQVTSLTEVFQLVAGESPLIAAAIHAGHFVREEVAARLALSSEERLREEDPYTDFLIQWAPTRMVGLRSRYEIDLNRPRETAVYRTPAEAWGANVWTDPLPADAIDRSLASYDLFYGTVEAMLRELVKVHERVIVLDVHTYNHRRDGAAGTCADPQSNPEVNIGTASMDRRYWAPVVGAVIGQLRGHNYLGRRLDVRENIKFKGGNFCRWIHETFPHQACAIAIEFKKFFMDEWTGEVDRGQLAALRSALESTGRRLLQIRSQFGAGNKG